MTTFVLKRVAVGVALASLGCAAQALEWSDNSVSYRYGTRFAEPYISDPIAKNIVSFTHVDGYKYGTNFFTADALFSDKKDPIRVGSESGAHEVYVVYRHTLDFSKVSGTNLGVGPFRSFGATAGFDWNTKSDAGYNSRKRMLVAGPTVMMDVPGFLNISLLALWESNSPYNGYKDVRPARYSYDTHPALSASWGIPFSIGPVALSYEGYANIIGAKGNDEFGNQTKSEIDFNSQIMYDASSAVGASKNTFKVGFQYQYWKNKFGNNASGPAGQGAIARTPMIRAEYHF